VIACAQASLAGAEPMPGSAPRADAWVVVEHPAGWGDAGLARTGHGVRVLMARGRRDARPPYRVWVAHTDGDPILRRGALADPAEVADWDLAAVAAGQYRAWGEPDPDPLLLVCANGRRDPCCGHAGRRLADRLRAGSVGERVLTSTHLGGHRFAPTALLLPHGVLHGRLDEDAALAVLASAALGRTPTETLRGFSHQTEPAQVAEVHARRITGYDGLAALPVTVTAGPSPEHASATVRLPSGGTVGADLARVHRETITSCGRAPEPLERWVVEDPR
jgi:hypothetical protein